MCRFVYLLLFCNHCTTGNHGQSQCGLCLGQHGGCRCQGQCRRPHVCRQRDKIKECSCSLSMDFGKATQRTSMQRNSPMSRVKRTTRMSSNPSSLVTSSSPQVLLFDSNIFFFTFDGKSRRIIIRIMCHGFACSCRSSSFHDDDFILTPGGSRETFFLHAQTRARRISYRTLCDFS